MIGNGDGDIVGITILFGLTVPMVVGNTIGTPTNVGGLVPIGNTVVAGANVGPAIVGVDVSSITFEQPHSNCISNRSFVNIVNSFIVNHYHYYYII